MVDIETTTGNVVTDLSTIIACEMRALSTEYWAPRLAPDQSDAEIKFRRQRIKRLRELREEFEQLMHGMTAEGLQ